MPGGIDGGPAQRSPQERADRSSGASGRYRPGEVRDVGCTHRRNGGPMQASRRCGARTRAGTPCRAPAIVGKAPCRMHGGAIRRMSEALDDLGV
jgi:hypothetical protein